MARRTSFLIGLGLILFSPACSVAPDESSENGDADLGPSGGTRVSGGSGGREGGGGSGGVQLPSGGSGQVASGGSSSGGNSVGGALGTGGSESSAGGSPTGTGGLSGTGGSSPTCAGPALGTSGTNPLFSEIFTADPAVLIHDCTFYITAGHDEGTNGFLLRDWYVLSSTDMVTWDYHGGPVLTLGTFAWANANAWASQMVERDGKFFWYVPVNQAGGAMTIGVAVGDSPLGPFTDAIGGPLIDDQFEMEAFGFTDPGQTAYTIDPSVFIDDDGQAYLIYGSFWRMIIARLGEDMISIEGEMIESTPPDFFEAPFLTKRGDIYYVVYAAGQNPATIDYVMAESPFGPWYGHKQIMAELPNLPGQDAATSHPAIAEFLGQWYLVYHLSNGPGGGTYRRQVAIEKLTFNEDGTIEPVTPSSGISF